MARTPLLNVRVDDARRARWEAAANDQGESLSDYIRDAVDARVESESGGVKGKRRAKAKQPDTATQSSRTVMCVHRVPATSFCSRCDR